jgi:hypothetical protein
MTDLRTISGHCLCGAAGFTAKRQTFEAGVCHCGICRRWTGGIDISVECEGDGVELTGEENISVYRSSDWGERGFCKICGSSLFWRLQDGSYYALSLGALDSTDGIAITKQIFVDEKPTYYDLANKTAMLTGAEVMAMMTGGNGDG